MGEKNPKWLQDDYVKFIRFAQWKIDQAGEGVLGFITNHSYLDNPTFRGMRQSLMKSFNEIYILDLHGNSLKKETCPDGSKDENVFDIRQGVSIAFFMKKNDKNSSNVFHLELWGLREHKYNFLSNHSIETVEWQHLSPSPDFYFFIPRDEQLLSKYDRFMKITDIFEAYSVGITTARDNLTIKRTTNEIWNTILSFSKMDSELARISYRLGKDARDWKVDLAQKDLLDSGLDYNNIVSMLYRPFDVRYTYYTGKSRGFLCMPRYEIMHNMLQENIGLVTNREVNGIFKHALCTDTIINDCTVSSETRERSYLFPLFYYSDPSEDDLITLMEGKQARKININHKILTIISNTYSQKTEPEKIFYYIYAILYANIYRKQYADFLKTDFPKIPFTNNPHLFMKLSDYGKQLVNLHLLKSIDLYDPCAKFQGKANEIVEKLKYDEYKEQVYINNDQYFEGVAKEIWEYFIGGYQVCHKWLKDRKGRSLSLEEIKQYCKIVTAIKQTISIQHKIDEIYPEIEQDVINFST